jgi:hypothetical protein
MMGMDKLSQLIIPLAKYLLKECKSNGLRCYAINFLMGISYDI